MNTLKKLAEKIGSRKTNRLAAAGLVFIFVIFPLLAPNFAYAADDDCWFSASCWVNWVVSWISYFIALVAGIFIAVEAWMIGILLAISSHIVDSPAVEAGFPITLSLTNLGFVLGIIIIAIATILRYEQYGMKKILLKLVAAAILVNFSLVIAGVIIDFSNQLTGFFLNSLGGPTQFASQIAGAFQPQREFTFVNESNTGAISADDLKKIQGGFASPAGSGVSGSIGEVLAPLASLVFVVATLIVMVITLFALIIMLVIRYIFLGILLVLMPLVWVAWIFPLTQSHWQKWWNQFLRWTFFSPIVVFFLWVAITAASKVNSGQGIFKFDSYKTTDGAWAAVAAILTNIFTPLVVNMMQASIVVGLMVGGLFAANSMGIAFAGTAYGAVKSIGKGAGAWVGRRSKQLGGATMDRLGIRKAAEKLQTTQIGRGTGLGSKLLKYTGVGAATRFGAGWLGRGIETLSVKTREDLVKDARRRHANMTPAQLAHGMSTFTAPERIAALERLVKEGEITQDKNFKQHMDKGLFERYGQGNLYKKLDQAEGNNEEGRNLLVDDRSSVQDIANAIRDTITSTSRSDASGNKNSNDLWSGKAFGSYTPQQTEKLLKAQARNYLEFAPRLIASIMPGLKGKSLENFIDTLRSEGTALNKEHNEESDRLGRQPHTPETAARMQEIEDRNSRLQQALKSLETTISNNTLGYIGNVAQTQPGETTTQSPPSPSP